MKRPSQFAADFREMLELSPDQVVPEMIPLLVKAEYKYCEEDFADDFAAFTEWLGADLYLIAFNSRKQYGPIPWVICITNCVICALNIAISVGTIKRYKRKF